MRMCWIGVVLLVAVCSHAPREAGSHAAPLGDPWEALREGNRRFVAERPLHRDLGPLRKELVEGQRPAEALAAVEANVRRVGQDLLDGSPILAKEVEEGKLRVVLAVYHLGSGEVVPLAR